MSDGSSISPEKAGIKLSAKDKLPKEVNKETDSGEFARSVLGLIEEQVGFSLLSEPDRLGAFTSNGSYLVPTLAGISKDGAWMVMGTRNDIKENGRLRYSDRRDDSPPQVQVDEAPQYGLTNVPLIEVEIHKVKPGTNEDDTSFSYDTKAGQLKVTVIGNELKGYKGFVSYGREQDNNKWDGVNFGSVMGDNVIELSGDPPGFKRGFFSKLPGRIGANREAAQAVPAVIGSFIDQLPPKSNWEMLPKGMRDLKGAYTERTRGTRVTNPAPAVKS